MFGILILAMTPVTVTEEDYQIFVIRYDPQLVLINRLTASNHVWGDKDWDPSPADKSPALNLDRTTRGKSFAAYMGKQPYHVYKAWLDDATWRYDCWNMLENVVNHKRYGMVDEYRLKSLDSLYKLLGPERFRAGWMPAPIPDNGPRINWLHDLWTERTGFQGRLNNLRGVTPLD
jgi:hypothetical protein